MIFLDPKIETVDCHGCGVCFLCGNNHGGSGGILPPSGVKGQSPLWGFRGQSPLPLIVLIKICTVPDSLQKRNFQKNIILRKLFFGQSPLLLIVLIKICTVPDSSQKRNFQKNIILRKLFFGSKPPAPYRSD